MLSKGVVAGISIDAVSPKGEAFVVTLQIGTPYQLETGEWACPLALGGLYDQLADTRGEDSFQALCLAIALAQNLLQSFRDEGGRLLSGSDDFPLEAYWFGSGIDETPG
jgi:hypothetical protein